jgi:hypothetical protein
VRIREENLRVHGPERAPPAIASESFIQKRLFYSSPESRSVSKVRTCSLPRRSDNSVPQLNSLSVCRVGRGVTDYKSPNRGPLALSQH